MDYSSEIAPDQQEGPAISALPPAHPGFPVRWGTRSESDMRAVSDDLRETAFCTGVVYDPYG